MPANTIIVNDDVSRERLVGHIRTISVEGPWEFTWRPYVKRRSSSQNALMWKWVNEVAEHVVQHTGQDAEDVHEFFKRKFLHPRQAEIGGETFQIYSTKKLTTSEMSEYMERIYAWATSELGLLLPLPEELHARK
jgi:hypothetical protein